MMKLKHIVWDTQTIAEELLKNWTLEPEELIFWRASSNFIYRCKFEGNTYFLRFAVEEDQTKEYIESELEFLLYLRHQRYPCAKPVASLSQDWMHSVTTEKGTFHGCLFKAAPGELLKLNEMSEDIVLEWGNHLAELHEQSKLYEAPFDQQSRNIGTILKYIENIFILKRVPEFVLETFYYMESMYESMTLEPESFGMIHFDFEADNCLFDEERHKFTIIDFNDCMMNLYAVDVERALNNISEEVEDRDLADELKKAFLEGYYEKRVDELNLDSSIHPAQIFSELYRIARILNALDETDVDMNNVPDWYIPCKNRLTYLVQESIAKIRVLRNIEGDYFAD